MLSKVEKQNLVKKFGNVKNPGSSAVQIAILTKEIELLDAHFKENKKDLHSRRGFIAKIERRKSLLSYLRRNDFNQYQSLIKELNLRK